MTFASSRRAVGVVLVAALLMAAIGLTHPADAVAGVHSVSVGDARGPEGNSGSTNFVFTVTQNLPNPQAVTVAYTTQDISATAGTDYVAKSGEVTFAPGQTTATITVTVLGDVLAEPDETFRVVLTSVQDDTASIADGEGIGTITNDDAAPPTVSVEDTSASEDTSSLSFTVRLSRSTDQDVIVRYDVSPGTATPTADYTPPADGRGTLTIPAGQVTGTIVVPIVDDAVDEPDETVFVDLRPGETSNAAILDGRAVGTIVDDEGTPTLTVGDVVRPEGDTGSSNAIFTVTLSAASAQTVTVAYATVPGSAAPGADYTETQGTVTFAPGDTSETVAVPVHGDTLDETDETFTLELRNPQNAACGDCSGLGTITDDDATPTLTVDNPSVTEGHSGTTDLVFTVTLSAASGQTVTAAYSTSGGTATPQSDYTPQSGTVTFEPGETQKTIDVPVVGDSLDEENETVDLTLTVDATSNAGCGDCAAVGTINDDDRAPTVSVAPATGSENESAGSPSPAEFTVTLSAPSGKPVTVGYTTTSGSATEGTDFTDATGTLTFAAGETSKTVPVTILEDNVAEGTETFSFTVTPTANATCGTCTATGTVLDDDQPLIDITNATITETESDQTMVFTVTLTAPSSGPVSVGYRTEDRTAKGTTGVVTAGSDYRTTSGVVTFAAGETTKDISVTIIGDTAGEPEEYFLLLLENADGATIRDGEGRGTITDDDGAPAASFTVNDPTVVEGTGGTRDLVFTVTKAGSTLVTTEVSYRTTDGTATAGSDYTTTSGKLTFGPTDTSLQVRVPIATDSIDEVDETVLLTLFEPANAAIADGEGTGTIDDDDGPTISISDLTLVEGDSGTRTGELTVSLSGPSAQDVKVTVASADGTASAPGDYTEIAPRQITIPAGSTSTTVQVTVVGDTTDEADETFNVVLSAPVDATIAKGTGVVTIDDDDGPGISVADVTADENDGTATVTVKLSAASPQPVTVSYRTTDATAKAPADYTAVSGTLVFAPGDTEKSVGVTLVDDSRNESNETFTFDLTAPSEATITDSSAIVTIVDDDALPTVSIGNASVTEGSTGTATATFAVTLSAVSGRTVTVDYATADGTATAPGDYTATSGTVTFQPGETTKNVTVVVDGDAVDEENETFLVELSNPVFATIDDGSGTGTITDDDASPSFTISDATVTEGNTGTVNAMFTVTKTGATDRPTSVQFATADGSASAPVDYTATNGTLTFAAAETTKTISVTVNGDTADEPNETFTVTLSSPSANSTIADGTGTGTINDDDEPATTTTARPTTTTAAPTTTTTAKPAGNPSAPQGYSLVGEDGSLYAFGTAKNVGDMRGKRLNAPIIGVAYTPGGNGYWLVAKDGGIFTFGDAEFFGSMGDKKLNSPVIGMAATPSGKGYWLFAGDGGIFTFGDAEFFGSMGDKKLNAPVINMEPLDSGRGYWLVAADGGIFTFGLGEFFGSMGDKKLNQPVFDMTSSDTDKGYWLVARDGGIFSFGDAEAKFFGSAVNETPRPTRIIGMDATPGSQGYWIADASGKVYRYGDAQDLGDRSGSSNPAPMVAFATVPGLKPIG